MALRRARTTPSGDGPDVEALLKSTLWSPKFQYETPRFLPGPRRVLRRARWEVAKRFRDLAFDRKLGTARHAIEPDHLHPDRVWYQPSGWNYLPRVLRREDVSPTDVFVDFGSGKGRVLYQAAQYPFARVVGVEISPAIGEEARQNLARRRHRLACQNVEVVTADATTFEIPDDMTFAYFYYPFVGETFRRVVANIVASLDRNPRRLTIIYALPEMERAILETGRFRLVRSKGISDMGIPHRISVYESVPAV